MDHVAVDKMVKETSDKWMAYLGGSSALQTEAARREADNERARQDFVRLDEPKAYDVRLKAEAAKTLKLRALRLVKEAKDRDTAVLVAPTKAKPRRHVAE